MIVWLGHYMLGYLTIEICGESPERFMNMCVHHKIEIWELKRYNGMFRLKITKAGFMKLRPIIRKTKNKIIIIARHGLPFFLFKHRHRRMFLIGFLVCTVTWYILSQFIWNINIIGNQYYSEQSIIEYLNSEGIYSSMLIKNIDCEDIVSLLRAEFNYAVWVSVYIEGSELVVELKENDQINMNEVIDREVEEVSAVIVNEDILDYGMDIIAEASGTISSMITRSGTPLVHIGDTVEKGDVLVSGCIEILNDDGTVINYKYLEADADITINTTYEYYDTEKKTYSKKIYLDEVKQSFYLKFNQYYLELNLGKNLVGSYEMVTKEYSIAPQQQSILNIAIGRLWDISYELEEALYTDDEIQEILSSRFILYCEELMQKKVEIIENNVKIQIDEKYAVASGVLQVIIWNEEQEETEIRIPLEETAQEGLEE